jgi:hypothetical protein
MTNTSVQITVRKLEKCRHDGPARHSFMVQETAYRTDGTAYPAVIQVVDTRTAGLKEKASVQAYLDQKYAGRIVPNLDMTPIIAQLF